MTKPEIAHSISETEAFKMRVGRLTLVGDEPDVVCDELASSELFDLVIFDVALMSSTCQLAFEGKGWRLRSAGTIVEWTSEAKTVKDRAELLKHNEGVDFTFLIQDSPLFGDGSAAIPKIAKQIFNDYPNHYLFSPELGEVNSGDAFSDQVERCMRVPGYQLSLVAVDGMTAAMSLTKLSGSYLEILLAGVIEEHRAQGVYGFLIANIAEYASDNNISHLRITTQAENTRVQRRWVDFGFKPSGSVRRIHAFKHSGNFS